MNTRRSLLFIGLAFAWSGCAKQESQPTSLGGSKVIGYSMLTASNPFFDVISKAIQEEAGKHGYQVIPVSGDEDVKKQSDQVRDFIVRKVSAIVLNPCDSKSIGPAIEEANKAGIPVFTCDIKCDAPAAKVLAHIATNNFQGGQMAAEAMIEALGEAGGKVLILDKKEVESCTQRVAGFKETIAAKAGGKIQIVSELPGSGERKKGHDTAQAALQTYPDLAGIFAINDPSGLGAYAALEEAGKVQQVKIVAFDGQPEGKQAIKDGRIYADPIQFPDEIGRQTVRAMMDYFAGKKVEAEQLIPTKLYRKQDGLADPSLK